MRYAWYAAASSCWNHTSIKEYCSIISSLIGLHNRSPLVTTPIKIIFSDSTPMLHLHASTCFKNKTEDDDQQPCLKSYRHLRVPWCCAVPTNRFCRVGILGKTNIWHQTAGRSNVLDKLRILAAKSNTFPCWPKNQKAPAPTESSWCINLGCAPLSTH